MKMFIARMVAYSLGFIEAMYFHSWKFFLVNVILGVIINTLWLQAKKAWKLDEFLTQQS